jgi:hypothetical protein
MTQRPFGALQLDKLSTSETLLRTQGDVVAFSFALMQKKQKIKDNPIAPRVCPAIPLATSLAILQIL